MPKVLIKLINKLWYLLGHSYSMFQHIHELLCYVKLVPIPYLQVENFLQYAHVNNYCKKKKKNE